MFERGLDPDKRAQLGAHYTDRDKIMLLVDPVVVRPLLAEWDAEKTAIAAELERAEATKFRPAPYEAAERRRGPVPDLPQPPPGIFTVLDPACGSLRVQLERRLGRFRLPTSVRWIDAPSAGASAGVSGGAIRVRLAGRRRPAR